MAGAKYPLAIRILHWLIALLIISLLAVGLYMTSLPKDAPTRGLLYGLHKSFGVTVLVLAVLRVGFRLSLVIPPLPEIIPHFERLAANAGHFLLYCFMIAMPVSGYVMSMSYGRPVSWFGFELPHLLGVDIALGGLALDFHKYAAYTLILVIAGHVTAVAWHYARQKVNLLKRMW